MQAGFDGDLQLGADAVGGRNDQGIDEAGGLEIEKGAEPAEARIRAWPPRGPGQGLDRFDQRRARIDVHAGLGIGQAVWAVGHGCLGNPVHGHGRRPLLACRLAPSEDYN